MPLRKTKTEAREERRLLKEIKFNKEKEVRLARELQTSQSVRVPWVPTLDKNPRIPIPTDNYKILNLTWCITKADREGEWSWGELREWSSEEFKKEIESHLNNLIGSSWNQIETDTYNGAKQHRKLLNKYQPIDSLCEEAQIRWNNDLELSEFEEIFRFRRGTKKRIWGVRVYDHFFTIWYERRHLICPLNND